MTYIFVYIFEVGELFDNGLIDKAKGAHQIDILM